MLTTVQAALEGRYQLDRELGRGGMGAVYLATDLRLQRPVAIKVLPPELAVQAELRERFLRETRMAASFSHPNIVPVFAVEELPSLLCFVMGFVDGETLTERVRRAGPMNAGDATRLMQEVAWALSYAHGRGTVHRDIKPDNILIERATGRALVTDFGIARSGATSTLTQVGAVVGTPPFMSPEQAAGEELDGRSDLYSLGVVGFFAITGRLPFEAPSAQAVMAMHLTQPAPRSSSFRPELPRALTEAIDRCLAKGPDERYATGEALAIALDTVRVARRDIAPALRLFHQQAGQGLRATIILTVAGTFLVSRMPPGSDADAGLVVVVMVAVLWGLVAQLSSRARFLLRQGFRFEDVRAAFLAIETERRETLAEMRGNAEERKRARRRSLNSLVLGLTSVIGFFVVVFKMRVAHPGGGHSVTPVGILMLLGSAVLFGIAISTVVTNQTRASLVEGMVTRFWSGPIGGAFFRFAAWRAAGQPVATVVRVTTPAGDAITAIDALPAGDRRRLGGARRLLEQLQAELARLAARDAELDGAISGASTGAITTDPALAARRQALVDELTGARRDAADRKARVEAVIENTRLQLVRVKSGLAPADVVADELRTATALLQTTSRTGPLA